MTETIEPKPEFRTLSEAAVMAALEDPSPENTIAVEVARLITAYTANFERHVEHIGRVPEAVLRSKARSPIESVAMQLTTEIIRTTIGTSRE